MKIILTIALCTLLLSCVSKPPAVSHPVPLRDTTLSYKSVDSLFGVSFGMDIFKVMSFRVKVNPVPKITVFDLYETDRLPRNRLPVEDMGYYTLVFYEERGLQKVVLNSAYIRDDPYGVHGRMLYGRVTNLLIAVHGRPDYAKEAVKYEYRDRYYECLHNSKCGRWVSVYKTQDSTTIGLELKGSEAGIGYLSITFEGKRFPK